jgi:two-component system OmpR family sensor kinase
MKPPRSLQSRLVWTVGLLVLAFWLAAATVVTVSLRHAIDEVFDAGLQETAQRILPLAVAEILDRHEGEVTQRLGAVRAHDEGLTYLVRDAQGRILLQSHRAAPADFPPWQGPGFHQSATHRFYSEEAQQGSVRITLAQPLAYRSAVTRDLLLGLGLPVLLLLPVAWLAIGWAVRSSMKPVRQMRDQLAVRHVRDLSMLAPDGLPAELVPMVDTLNDRMQRLAAAFDAEQHFSAHAAHELRTPLAGAIAQLQRLKAEAADPRVTQRVSEIETALKRLTRISTQLMALARAEGGALRRGERADLVPVLHVVTDEVQRLCVGQRVRLNLPDTPFESDIDPDIFGILYRNLLENAFKHGNPADPVTVSLSPAGVLLLANDGPAMPPERLSKLGNRFERAGASSEGSGLGLAIVQAVTQRLGGTFTCVSPRPGQATGFEVRVRFPVTRAGA